MTNWLALTDEELRDKVDQLSWVYAYKAAERRGNRFPGAYADRNRNREKYRNRAFNHVGCCIAMAEAGEQARNN